MNLRRLEIIQLPGIRPGFALEAIDPGVNLVLGPNASGKSSLVRALRHLFSPRLPSASGPVTLAAQFATDDEVWDVVRSGSQIAWRKAGRPDDAPNVPAGDFLHCYWMGMDDLLHVGATDRAIVERLRREFFGGVDPDSLRGLAEFDIGPRHGQIPHRELREAAAALQAVETRHAALARRQSQLPQLREATRRAEAAGARANRLELALELLALRRERIAAEGALQTFPPSLAKLRGDEPRTLERLERRRAELIDERRRVDSQLAEQQRIIRSHAWPDTAPAATDFAARRQDLEELRALRARHAELSVEQQRAVQQEQEAIAALGGTPGSLPQLTPAAIDRAAQLADRQQHTRLRLQQLQLAADAMPAGTDDADWLRQSAYAAGLRRWLRLADTTTLRVLLSAGLAALALAAAAIAGALRGPGWLWAYAGGAGLVGVLLLTRFAAAAAERSAIGKQAAESGSLVPPVWNRSAVETSLSAAEERLIELRERQRQKLAATAAMQELVGARDEAQRVQQESATLAAEIGFDPTGLGAASVQRFLTLVDQRDRARTRRVEAEAALRIVEREIQQRLARVRDWVFLHQSSPAIEAHDAALRAACEALEARLAVLRDAQRSAAGLEQLLARLAQEIAQVDGEMDGVYRQGDLAPGDRTGLLAACGQLEAYRRQTERLRELRLRETDRHQTLRDEHAWLAQVGADDEPGLRELLRSLSDDAARVGTLREELSTLEAQLRQVGEGNELERARALYDQKRDALAASHEQMMFATAGHFLLDDVLAEHRAEHEPAVLQDARARFARYTANRYLLRLEGGSFGAFDTVAQAACSLEELSTGTRMQLLLAVRLAWTAKLEAGHERLPLFLDEALTTSDPERFAAIARSLQDTAVSERRQIFYLTAQPADAVRWRQATGLRPHTIDLLAVRFGGERHMAADVLPPDEPVWPAPDRDTAPEYAARIGVPAIDSSAGPGAVHLFHLLRDDLPLLHRLLQDWRIARLGPLEALLDSDAAGHAVADVASRTRLRDRCRIARAWWEAWTQGRGQPLDRDALERSGAIGDKLLDAVDTVAQAQAGDAAALLAALHAGDVPRFGQARIAKFTAWLEEQGYLDPRPVLPTAEREQRLLQNLGGAIAPAEIRFVAASLEAAGAFSE